MIDKNFITRKVSLIQNELVHLAPFKDYSFEEISKDFMKQAAMERFLERAINRAIDINQYILAQNAEISIEPPKDYRETFLRLVDLGIYEEEFAKNISRSVGTRNILAHDYDKAEQSLVYTSVRDCLVDYTKYCESILKFLKNN